MAQILTQARLATTVNIPLTTNLEVSPNNLIDGVAVSLGDRILVKAQSNKVENGVYVITDVSSHYRLVRASDFAAASTQTSGTIIFVQEGDTFADTGWIISTNGTITVGTTSIEFAKFSVNLAPAGSNIGSSITYRSEKGYPLTVTELDNNFRYITDNLVTKLNIVDFNSISVRDKINALTPEVANLDVWKLRGYAPSASSLPNSIALRDSNNDIYTRKFNGDLVGKADFAGVSDSATVAHNFDGMIAIANGGTNASTAAGARTNLAVVHIGGDTPMSGKLTLVQAGTAGASLNIPASSTTVGNLANGDIWTNSTNILYRLSNTTQTIAPLNAPVFTGGAQFAADIDISSNSDSLANTAYVQKHRTEINTALDLKAPLAAPALTLDSQGRFPTTPTVIVTDGRNKVQGDPGYDPLAGAVWIEAGSTTIANTQYVVNRINRTLLDYYTKTTTDTLISDAVSPLAPKASPTFTGTPVAPTAATNTNTTQIATTAYTVARIASELSVYSTTTQMNTAIDNKISTKANTSYVDGLQDKWGTSKKYVQSTAPTDAVDGDFWFKI